MLSTLNCRTWAGSWSGSRIHPENVPRPKPGQGQDAVPSFHLRHRHRKHPLRLCGRQRHHPQTQPEGVQPGVTRSTRTAEETKRARTGEYYKKNKRNCTFSCLFVCLHKEQFRFLHSSPSQFTQPLKRFLVWFCNFCACKDSAKENMNMCPDYSLRTVWKTFFVYCVFFATLI